MRQSETQDNYTCITTCPLSCLPSFLSVFFVLSCLAVSTNGRRERDKEGENQDCKIVLLNEHRQLQISKRTQRELERVTRKSRKESKRKRMHRK